MSRYSYDPSQASSATQGLTPIAGLGRSIERMIDSDNVRETPGGTASQAYTVNSYFMGTDNYFYRATTAIASGDTLTVGTNCERTDISTELTTIKSDLVDISTKITPVGVYLNWVSTITPSGDVFVSGGVCYMQCAFTCSDALIANVQHIIATIASSEQYPTNLAYGVVMSLAGSAGVIAVKPDGVILVNLSTPLQIGDMLYLDVTWRV